MKHLVAAENLAIAYPGGHIALQDVSFALAPGETLGIVGESGSGKTTLIRQLANLPSSHAAVVAGRILFRNEDVAAVSSALLAPKELSSASVYPLGSASPMGRKYRP